MSVTAGPIEARKIALVNPNGRQAKTFGAKRAQRTARSRTNPLYLLGPSLNPQKGGHTVAQTKPAKKKNAARKVKKNPFPSARPTPMQKKFKPAKRTTKRNPDAASVVGMLNQPIELLKFGLIALLGLVATRQVPQMALGDKNSNWLGYASNLGTALAGAYGTSRFAGKTAGFAFGVGGGLYTANRILTDKFTPVGRVLSLAGVGDPHASKNLGRIVPGTLYPPSYDAQGNLKLPPSFVSAARAAIAPPIATPGAASVSGLGASRLTRGGGRLAA